MRAGRYLPADPREDAPLGRQAVQQLAHAGETVTVTITVNNCDPTTTQDAYTVSGTDGYGAGDTLSVSSACQAPFTIPGGASGVVDTVTVEIVGAGVVQTVTYSF